jgi:hypothetical protein
MAYPPTSITITYVANPPTQNVSSGVTQTSSATLSIPAGSHYSDFVAAIFKAGGFWFPQSQNAPSSQTQTFTAASQITSIAAS